MDEPIRAGELRREIERRGMKIAEFATACGISYRTLARFFAGGHVLALRTEYRIRRYLRDGKSW